MTPTRPWPSIAIARRAAATLCTALLFAACATTSVPTRPPQTIIATDAPTPSAFMASPEPIPFAVACGPLDSALCMGAVDAVEARLAPLDLASIAELVIEPASSFLTCPMTSAPDASASVCSVAAFITFTEPGPLVLGMVRSGDQWISTGAKSGWWGTEGSSYCAAPAWYRLDGQVDGIGPCFGVLLDPAERTITLAVGETLDLHLAVIGRRYPLPRSTAPAVINIESASDAATATYRALSPGTATLVTVGSCIPKADTPTGIGEQFTGPCPVAQIHVNSTK